jgi:Fission yeast centromere protein N-terminal domain
MPETTSETTTLLPTTPTAPASPPKAKKRRRELTDAQRVEIRQFFYDESHAKLSQNEAIQWFEKQNYHTLI